MEYAEITKLQFSWISLTLFLLISLTRVKASEFNNGSFNISNCTLQPERKRMQFKLENLIDHDNYLIRLDITVQWNMQPPNDTYPEHLDWYMTTNNVGQHLLLLNDNFEEMSLGTLSYGIAQMHISLVQEPADCLGNMPADKAEKLVLFSLLTLPKTEKTLNEDDVSTLHVCTESVNNDGTCCNLTVTGSQVNCENLQEDIWLVRFSLMVNIVSFIAASHFIYLIPVSFYDKVQKDGKSSFTVLNSDFHIKLRRVVTNEYLCENREDWTKSCTLKSPFLETILDKLVRKTGLKEETYIINGRLKSVQKESDELFSEVRVSSGTLQNVKKTFSEMFVNLKQRCYKKSFSKCSKKTCCSLRCKIFQWDLCLITPDKVLFTLGLTFAVVITLYFMYKLEVPSFDIALMSGIGSIICIFYFILLNLKSNFMKNKMFSKPTESLRIFRNIDSEKAKIMFALLISPFSGNGCTFEGVILLIFQSSLLILIRFLPFLHFLGVCIKQIFGQNSWKKWLLLIYLYFFIMVFYFSWACLIFYTECLGYVLIGLFMNYDKVIDIFLLSLMILTYAMDCLHGVYKKINDFNSKIINILFDLSRYKRKEMLSQAINEGKNIAVKFVVKVGDENKDSVKIFVGDDGRLFFAHNRLFLFSQFKEPEKLPYMHIPKLFVDQLASKPGHLTPGPKYILLLKACNEILFVIIGIICIFTIIKGFGGINDISASVHTLVTLGSSAALIMVNKLIFKAEEYSLNDHEEHLKALVRRHLSEYEDKWIEDEDTVQSVECVRKDDISSNYDIVLQECTDEQGETKVDWFFRSHIQEDNEKMPQLSDLFGNSSIKEGYDQI